MLTGDSRTTAEAVGREARHRSRSSAEVLPAQKASRRASACKAEARMVAMAGDGINDAPALAQAHVGVAMGTGTDVAMESAGVTLVQAATCAASCGRGELSRATMREHPAEPVLRVRLQRARRARSQRACCIRPSAAAVAR